MKKFLLGIISGILCIVIIFTVVSYYRKYKLETSVNTRISKSVMVRFMQVFPKAEIKGVGVEPYSEKINLNFHYDKLFQITLDYKLNNKYKRVTFYIGTDKEHIIGPPELELLNLNNDATILYQE